MLAKRNQTHIDNNVVNDEHCAVAEADSDEPVNAGNERQNETKTNFLPIENKNDNQDKKQIDNKKEPAAQKPESKQDNDKKGQAALKPESKQLVDKNEQTVQGQERKQGNEKKDQTVQDREHKRGDDKKDQTVQGKGRKQSIDRERESEHSDDETERKIDQGEPTATTPAIETLLNSCKMHRSIKDTSKIEEYFNYFEGGVNKSASLCDKANYSSGIIKDVSRKAKDLLVELEKTANDNINEMYSKYYWLKSEIEFFKLCLLTKVPPNGGLTRKADIKMDVPQPIECSCLMPDKLKITYNRVIECYNFLSRCSDASNVSREPKHFSYDAITSAIEMVWKKAKKLLSELDETLIKDAKMLHETTRMLESEVDGFERILLTNIRAVDGRNNYPSDNVVPTTSRTVLYAPPEEKGDFSDRFRKVHKGIKRIKELSLR